MWTRGGDLHALAYPFKRSGWSRVGICLGYYACVKSLHLCPTHWDPVDRSPSGSSVHGIVQAGMLEWAAISCSNLPNPEMELKSLVSPVLVGEFFTTSTTWEALDNFKLFHQFQGYLMCFYFSQLAKKSLLTVLYHLPSSHT